MTTTRTTGQHRAPSLQKAVNGPTSPRRTVARTGLCPVCERALPKGRRLRLCSVRCRMRRWAVRELLRAADYQAIGGLRDEVLALAGRMK